MPSFLRYVQSGLAKGAAEGGKDRKIDRLVEGVEWSGGILRGEGLDALGLVPPLP